MSDSVDAFVGGDPAAARQLRRSLQVLADEYAGTPLGRQLADVSAGRLSMRELAGDPEVAALAHRGMEQYRAEVAALSPEQRRAEVARVTALATEDD